MRSIAAGTALTLALTLCLLAGKAQAQPAAPAADPGVPQVLLYPDGAPGALGTEAKDKPKIDVYLPSKETAIGTGVVIYPGGGYAFLSMKNEGSDIAHWLNSIGVAAFVTTYRIGDRSGNGYHQPVIYEDGQRAIRLVRSKAAEFGISPDRIGVIGFSAGGHMASTMETHFDAGNKDAKDPIDRFSCRPDFAILLYPVITMKPGVTHKGSHDNFLGPNPDAALEEKFSNELQVTPETPPTFIAQASRDTTVPVENSILFYQALVKAKVPAEMHLFEKGGHGFGLGAAGRNAEMPLAQWPKLCETWLRNDGWLTKPAAPADAPVPAAAPAAPATPAAASK